MRRNTALMRRPATWSVLLAAGGLLLGGFCAAFAWPHAASARARLQACDKALLNASPDPTIFVERVQGNVVGVTSFGTWGTSNCLLRTRLTFTVKRYAGREPGKT